MSDARALTLHQPWASLVAVGAKTIETRSRPTSYRGPLLIHAGKRPWRDVTMPEPAYGVLLSGGIALPAQIPLGAVVASSRLVDCVPTENVVWFPDDGMSGGRRWGLGDNCAAVVESERPFGDFSPGRWAWLLEDVKPPTERCPRCWYSPADPPALRPSCDTCNEVGQCAAVPMRGRQGLWTPAADDWAAAA